MNQKESEISMSGCTIKGFIVIFSIIIFFVYMGKVLLYFEQQQPIERVKWPDQIIYEKEIIKTHRQQINKSKKIYYQERPWSNERREETENWLDFLEEIEDRGYSIYDPEAEDIWEKHY